MKLSYTDLYRQYEQGIAQQNIVIARNRLRLHRAMRDCNMLEVRRLNAVLRVLYEEKSELEERAEDLLSYMQ